MTDVRLAYAGPPVALEKGLAVTDICLAAQPKEAKYPETFAMTDVRLATTGAMLGNATASGKSRYPHHHEHKDGGRLLRPALLVSFINLEQFQCHRDRYAFRNWALDSGAFSAHQSNKKIDHQEYIDTALRLLDEDPTLVEVFGLDVIGKPDASLRNCEEEWRQGLQAIPTYHIGSPEEQLHHLANNYPKIALGGMARFKKGVRKEWIRQCFAHIWPKRIHGFGISDRETVLSFPFDSVDSTSWEFGPCGFGQWKTFGKMSVRGSEQNLRVEVEWYLALEREARSRWADQLAKLDAETN